MNILTYVHLRNIHGSTGAGRVARNIVEKLAELDNTSLKILVDANDHRNYSGQIGAPWDRYSYCFFDRDTSRQQVRWLLLNAPKAESFWREADIVYCTAESYVPTRRARSVVTLHDAAFFEAAALPRNWASRKQRLKWELLYRIIDRRVDLFHTVSNFSAERIAHFFPSLESRLRVVPNGIADRFFQPVSAEGEAALAEAGLADRPFVLLPRGLNYRKNADLVLSAWPTLSRLDPDLSLVVTSHSDAAYVEKARSLGPSVKITGFVSDEFLCSLYTRAAAVWFPSRYEGFGIPVLEAMACGTPVVASRAASLPEVAGDAAILVPPDDPLAHVDALHDVLTNGEARSRLSTMGRQRAAAFTWASAAARLRAEFQALSP